jgi:hypothetical protein
MSMQLTQPRRTPTPATKSGTVARFKDYVLNGNTRAVMQLEGDKTLYRYGDKVTILKVESHSPAKR